MNIRLISGAATGLLAGFWLWFALGKNPAVPVAGESRDRAPVSRGRAVESAAAGKGSDRAIPVRAGGEADVGDSLSRRDVTEREFAPVGLSGPIVVAGEQRSGAGPALAAQERHLRYVAAKQSTLRPNSARQSFPVPEMFAAQPLPFFLRTVSAAEGDIHSPAEDPSEVADDTSVAASVSTDAVPARESAPAHETAALRQAEHLFLDALAAAPAVSAESPEYADWWHSARIRSEEYLRTTLGWDRFNALSRAESAQMLTDGGALPAQ